MKTLYIFSIAWILFLSCCKKNTEDKEAPVITLSTPVNNQVLTPGVIHIKGTVNDNQYIDQVHIEISNLNTGVEYEHLHIHPATKSYAFDQTFTVQAGINYKIKVIAEDPSANTVSSQIEVACN